MCVRVGTYMPSQPASARGCPCCHPCVRRSSLAEQLQVCDGHLAFLVTLLTHEPVGVHAGDGVDGDQLGTGA